VKAETYYAIRIGDPRRHHCYLKVREGSMIPEFFLDRGDAEKELKRDPGPSRKVVRVKVRPG
jgi:hypothetical protein